MTPDVERRRRFEHLATEVFDPLQRYLRRRAAPEDAADLFSETLMTLWRRLDEVPEDAALPWCYGVARRVLANHRRGRRRHIRLVARLEGQRPVVIPEPFDRMGDPDLANALASLPEPDQEILRLWAWEQLDPREIAEVLGITANAASLRLTRAKKKLAAVWPRQDHPGAGHEMDRHTEEQSHD